MRPELTEVGLARGHAGEAFVVAKVQIGFRAIVGDKHLAMFKGRHRAGVDVQIGVKLAQAHRIAARLQQCTQSGGCKTFAK